MIVVSDMSGTVTTGSPVLGLTKWVGSNQSALRANFYLGWNLPSYLLVKWGLIDPQRWGQGLMVTALPLIENPSRESLEQMGKWAVEYELWPKRRQEVIDRLVGHVKDGAQVSIASSVYEPVVKAFAERIGVSGIGTPLEITNGRARFAEPLVADEKKLEKVLRHLGVERVDVAYGDTWSDISLLEHADRAVAVYPDKLLRATAEERGWEVLGDREARSG